MSCRLFPLWDQSIQSSSVTAVRRGLQCPGEGTQAGPTGDWKFSLGQGFRDVVGRVWVQLGVDAVATLRTGGNSPARSLRKGFEES